MFHTKLTNTLKAVLRNSSNCLRSVHTEQKINVQGINVNVVQCGRGDQSVLLMPGALGSAWTDFKPQIEHLPQLLPNHTIITWDPPGYGKTIPPARQFGVDFFQNDARCAVDLMKALDRPKFSILGWSDGGITALITAGRFVENIDKVVIWGAGAYINADEVKALQNIRDVKKWSPRMREPMENVYGAEGFAILWSKWVDCMVTFHQQYDGDFCLKEVEKIVAPIFILHGKKDPLIAAEHIPFLRTRLQRHKYYEFPEGKHNIHLKYPNEFNKLVADFLLSKS